MPSFPYHSWYASPAYASANRSVVDPFHFVLFQHGVLGYAGDFENVIADLFIHHDVSLHEAYEHAVQQADRERARAARAPRRSGTASGNSSRDHSHGTKNTHGRPDPLRGFRPAWSSCGYDPETLSETRDHRAAQRRAARREEYRSNHFRLRRTYPFNRSGRLYQSGNLCCFAPGDNNFLGTGSGTVPCAHRMLAEFLPVFNAWLDLVERAREAEAEAENEDEYATGHGDRTRVAPMSTVFVKGVSKEGDEFASDLSARASRQTPAITATATTSACASASSPTLSPPPPASPSSARGPRHVPICFSCVGHSFGGLILREFLYLLAVDTVDLPQRDPELYASVLSLRVRMMHSHVQFENFLTIATPHCGTTECLWWPMYLGAWVIARLRVFKTYGELIVSDSEAVLMKRLVDVPHLAALKLFRRRTLFANTHRDLLVGFATSALIFETVPDDHTRAKGYRQRREAPCAAAFESDESDLSAAIYLPAHGEYGDVGATGRTTSMPKSPGCVSPALASPASSAAAARAIHGVGRGVEAPPASHTLFDLWEFHHTRTSTTLAPVDPLLMVNPSSPALSSPTRPASLRSVFIALVLRLRRCLARYQPRFVEAFTCRIFGPEWVEESDAYWMRDPPADVAETHGEASADDKRDEEEEVAGASAAGMWFHYDRFFPESGQLEGSGGDGEGGGCSLNHEEVPTVSGHPSPSVQFALYDVVTPEDVRQSLRAALAPSLSATVVGWGAGRQALPNSFPSPASLQPISARCGGSRNRRHHHHSSDALPATGTTIPLPITANSEYMCASGVTENPKAPPATAASSTNWAWVWPPSIVAPWSPLTIHRSGSVAAGTQVSSPLLKTIRGMPLRTLDTLGAAGFGSGTDAPSSVLTVPLRLLHMVFAVLPLVLMGWLLSGCWLLLQRTVSAVQPRTRQSKTGVTALAGGSEGKDCVRGAVLGHTAKPTDVGGGLRDSRFCGMSSHTEDIQECEDCDGGYSEDSEDEDEAARLRRLLRAHMRTLPPSRLTPRAIAHELRRDLDWRVRAVRSNLVLPFAHVVSLGNWAWAGTSPGLVMAVAEEIAHIL